MKSKANVLSKKLQQKVDKVLESLDDKYSDEFKNKFQEIIKYDVKNIKECSETAIVEFYIKEFYKLLQDYSYDEPIDSDSNELFWCTLQEKTRSQLVKKFVSKNLFDNNIDIYFNDVKREYILHPMNESESLEVIPENRDIFIKNNLKLVINCAKRYRNLGLPFEDLIQTGNLGLLIAWDKFDTDRANLQNNIIKSINSFERDSFTYDDASEIIKTNFKYTKLLANTLMKIPQEGFENKLKFIEWVYKNIKKASFSSIGFAWIRATITSSLNKMVNLIHIPNSAKNKETTQPLTIIKLDSLNPHTDDNYNDNIMNEYYQNDQFIFEDDNVENNEKKNMFHDLLENILINVNPIDKRILYKYYGIDLPFEMSLQEISENESISINKVKTSLNNTLAYIASHINKEDKKTLMELFK